MSTSQIVSELPRKKVRIDIEKPAKLLAWQGVHTVCEESRCPNRNECSKAGIATFLIGGRVCTRACKFCHIATGKGLPLAEITPAEKADILSYVENKDLSYVVITAVARDDDEAGLAHHFADLTVELNVKNVEVELLIPDFHARPEILSIVGQARPLVIAQNMETVERLSPKVRPQAGYKRTLQVFDYFKNAYPEIILKSGFMVGLGESREELVQLLTDLKSHGVEIITAGQYLQPSQNQLPVSKIYSQTDFQELENLIEQMDFSGWEVGHYVRSSYMASRTMQQVKNRKLKSIS